MLNLTATPHWKKNYSENLSNKPIIVHDVYLWHKIWMIEDCVVFCGTYTCNCFTIKCINRTLYFGYVYWILVFSLPETVSGHLPANWVGKETFCQLSVRQCHIVHKFIFKSYLTNSLCWLLLMFLDFENYPLNKWNISEFLNVIQIVCG